MKANRAASYTVFLKDINQQDSFVKKMEGLDGVRKVAFKDSLIDILKNLDQDLVKGAVAGEKFQELFFANCKNQEIADYVKTLLA